MAKYDPQILFNKWKKRIKQEDIAFMYKAEEREGYLELLVKAFKGAGLDLADASMFRNDVMTALTTVEGRKGKGKYKGWKEQVVTDFEEMLADYYIPDSVFEPEDIKKASLEDKEPWMTMQDFHGKIKQWLTDKYGFTESKYKLACTTGHTLNIEFMQDVFGVKI